MIGLNNFIEIFLIIILFYKPIMIFDKYISGVANFFWLRSTKKFTSSLRIDFHRKFLLLNNYTIMKKHIGRVALKVNSNMIDFEIFRNRLFGRP